mmetsp:Transcript_1234/g.3789  ORF Transcript_1234/g.3789 Transcript_1234/m.3789 type:complete len:261 (-) Transcript_1234:1057-1839(-)
MIEGVRHIGGLFHYKPRVLFVLLPLLWGERRPWRHDPRDRVRLAHALVLDSLALEQAALVVESLDLGRLGDVPLEPRHRGQTEGEHRQVRIVLDLGEVVGLDALADERARFVRCVLEQLGRGPKGVELEGHVAVLAHGVLKVPEARSNVKQVSRGPVPAVRKALELDCVAEEVLRGGRQLRCVHAGELQQLELELLGRLELALARHGAGAGPGANRRRPPRRRALARSRGPPLPPLLAAPSLSLSRARARTLGFTLQQVS